MENRRIAIQEEAATLAGRLRKKIPMIDGFNAHVSDLSIEEAQELLDRLRTLRDEYSETVESIGFMLCGECSAKIFEYRVVGVYDQAIFPQDVLKAGDLNTYFYVDGTFIPLGMTRCSKCGNVRFWDLRSNGIAGLTQDRSKKPVFDEQVSDDEG